VATSAVVGLLRVLLTMNTADFESSAKRAAGVADSFAKDMKKIGQQATQVGQALTRTLTVPLVALGAGAIKAASDFESSFAGVRKTVNATEPEFAALAKGLRNMAKEIPVNVNELNKVAESAGQLGVKKEDILQFTRTMADLGVTTNLTADEAATSTAQFQNIFGSAGKDVDRFGATLVALGNAGASTEKDIIEMGLRIAGAGNQVGLSQGQVMAFASSLSSVGINAEAGGSAISRTFLKINDAVMSGGPALDEFARVAGMTAEQFKTAFQTDAAGATTAFIAGLGRLKGEGENVNATLEGMVGKNIIIKDTLLRASGAGSLLTDNLKLQAQAWKDNAALTKEAEERYKTFESQVTMLWSQVRDLGITLGTALMPTFRDMITVIRPVIGMVADLATRFSALPQPVRTTAVAIGVLVASVGPVLWAFGSVTTAIGTVVGAFGKKGIAMAAITKAWPVLAAALTSSAAVALGTTGLVIALGVALWEVAKAFKGLYEAWASGSGMWAFLSARDEDNFVRRWLGLSDGVKKAAEASQGAVGGFDAAADAAKQLKDRLSGADLARDVSALSVALQDLTAAGELTGPALDRIKQEAKLLKDRGAELSPELHKLVDSIRPIKPAATEAAGGVDKLKEAMADLGGGAAVASAQEAERALTAIGGPLKVLPSQLDQLKKKFEEGAAGARALGNVKLAEHFEALSKRVEPMAAFQAKWNVKIGEYVLESAKAATATELVDAQIQELGNTVTRVGPILESTMTNAMKGLGGAAAGTNLTFPAFKAPVVAQTPGKLLADGVVGSFSERIKTQLGPAILSAFQGGGSVGKTIGGFFGNELGSWAGKVAGPVLGKVFGQGVGGSLGAMFGPVGTMVGGFLGEKIGSIAGSLFGKVFGGASKEVLKARTDVAAFQSKLNEGLSATQRQEAGTEQWRMTVVRVRDAYLATGRSAADAEAIVKQLWDTQRPERAAAAMQTINDVLEEQGQLLEANKGQASQLFDDIMAAGSTGIPAAYRPAIDQLIALGLLTDEQAAKLRGLKDATGPSIAAMESALKVINGRVESLGPAFAQAKITEKAMEYANAIQTMIDGGGDVGGILFDAKEELGALVAEAIKSGKTLPANLKPWIDDLVKSGNLIDASGNKITDVSNLKWGEEIKTEAQIAKEGWDRIILAIETLVAKISGPLEQSIDRVTRDRRVTVDVDYRERRGESNDSQPEGDRTGFATGTKHRIGSYFANFGAGTRTMLHGVEAVLRPQDALPFATSVLSQNAAMPGASESTTTNSLNILPVIMGGNKSPREIGHEAVQHLASSGLPMNEAGVTTAFEQVIENYMRTYARA